MDHCVVPAFGPRTTVHSINDMDTVCDTVVAVEAVSGCLVMQCSSNHKVHGHTGHIPFINRIICTPEQALAHLQSPERF